jgi:hypothetical protein
MRKKEFPSSKNEFFCLSPFIFSIFLTPASLMFSPHQIILNLNFYRGKILIFSSWSFIISAYLKDFPSEITDYFESYIS